MRGSLAAAIAVSAVVAPLAIAACSSDDSGAPAKCGPGTDIPCIDGSLPDSPIFEYDAPAQHADVVLPDVRAGEEDADADANANADAGANANADADAPSSDADDAAD